MSKCITCGKEDDGIICSHCLTKGASMFGKGLKKVGGFLVLVGLTFGSAFAMKKNVDKDKTKI
jgi:hypothetical protein